DLGRAGVLARLLGDATDREDRDCGEDAEDGDDDEQFDQGEALLDEALLVLHFVHEFVLHCCSLVNLQPWLRLFGIARGDRLPFSRALDGPSRRHASRHRCESCLRPPPPGSTWRALHRPARARTADLERRKILCASSITVSTVTCSSATGC